jgi:hypothetical protein
MFHRVGLLSFPNQGVHPKGIFAQSKDPFCIFKATVKRNKLVISLQRQVRSEHGPHVGR